MLETQVTLTDMHPASITLQAWQDLFVDYALEGNALRQPSARQIREWDSFARFLNGDIPTNDYYANGKRGEIEVIAYALGTEKFRSYWEELNGALYQSLQQGLEGRHWQEEAADPKNRRYLDIARLINQKILRQAARWEEGKFFSHDHAAYEGQRDDVINKAFDEALLSPELDTGNFGAFVTSVIHKRIIDFHRARLGPPGSLRNQHSRAISLDAEHGFRKDGTSVSAYEQIGTKPENTEGSHTIDAASIVDQIWHFAEGLPTKRGEVLLTFLEEKSKDENATAEEMAAKIGMTPSTFLSHMHLIREQLVEAKPAIRNAVIRLFGKTPEVIRNIDERNKERENPVTRRHLEDLPTMEALVAAAMTTAPSGAFLQALLPNTEENRKYLTQVLHIDRAEIPGLYSGKTHLADGVAKKLLRGAKMPFPDITQRAVASEALSMLTTGASDYGALIRRMRETNPMHDISKLSFGEMLVNAVRAGDDFSTLEATVMKEWALPDRINLAQLINMNNRDRSAFQISEAVLVKLEEDENTVVPALDAMVRAFGLHDGESAKRYQPNEFTAMLFSITRGRDVEPLKDILETGHTGNIIRWLQHLNGLTIDHMGDFLKISNSPVNTWEKSNKPLEHANARDFALALDSLYPPGHTRIEQDSRSLQGEKSRIMAVMTGKQSSIDAYIEIAEKSGEHVAFSKEAAFLSVLFSSQGPLPVMDDSADDRWAKLATLMNAEAKGEYFTDKMIFRLCKQNRDNIFEDLAEVITSLVGRHIKLDNVGREKMMEYLTGCPSAEKMHEKVVAGEVTVEDAIRQLSRRKGLNTRLLYQMETRNGRKLLTEPFEGEISQSSSQRLMSGNFVEPPVARMFAERVFELEPGTEEHRKMVLRLWHKEPLDYPAVLDELDALKEGNRAAYNERRKEVLKAMSLQGGMLLSELVQDTGYDKNIFYKAINSGHLIHPQHGYDWAVRVGIPDAALSDNPDDRQPINRFLRHFVDDSSKLQGFIAHQNLRSSSGNSLAGARR